MLVLLELCRRFSTTAVVFLLALWYGTTFDVTRAQQQAAAQHKQRPTPFLEKLLANYDKLRKPGSK